MFVDVYCPLLGNMCKIAELLIRERGVGIGLNDHRLKAAILKAKETPCPVHDGGGGGEGGGGGGGGGGRRGVVGTAARRPQEADVSRCSHSDTESIPVDMDGRQINPSPIYSPAASLNAAAAFTADVLQKPESEDNTSVYAAATSLDFPASTASISVTSNTAATSTSFNTPTASVNLMRPRVVKTTPPPAVKQHKHVKSLQCDKEELYFTPPKAGEKIRFYFAWIDTPDDFFIIFEENKIRLDGLTLDMFHFYQRSVIFSLAYSLYAYSLYAMHS